MNKHYRERLKDKKRIVVKEQIPSSGITINKGNYLKLSF